MNQEPTPRSPDDASRPKASVDGRSWRQRTHEGMNLLNAKFKDSKLEAAFKQHFIDQDLPRERLMLYIGVGIFTLFGALDLLTITENRSDILFLRWAVATPLVTGLISLTYLKPFKRFFAAISAVSMFLFVASIIAMTVMMQAEGAPPYLIGILVTFIFSAMVLRIDFLFAAAVFTSSTALYTATIMISGRETPAEQIAGLAFIFSISLVSLTTSYLQELRVRHVWRRDLQRDKDAQFIESLLIEATAADKAKNNFMAILSHELRTPLHQIIGFSELVANQIQDGKKDEAEGHLAQVHQSATGLLKQIGKMLRYADASAGKIKHQIESIPVSELLYATTDQLKDRIAEKNISLSSERIEEAVLRIDFNHTTFALQQLLDNAVNATAPGGKIEITGVLTKLGYQLQIRDHAGGMSPSAMKAAMSPFTQGEEVRTRSIEGIGLGLTLSRTILQGQNATFDLQSELGVGTVVSMVFPIEVQATDDRNELQQPAGNS